MKILILGASQVGRSIARVLVAENNDVTMVDINPVPLRLIQDRLDIRTLVGNAAYPSVLRDAGGEDAELLLAVTDSDEVNMLACQVAATVFGTPKKIARVRSNDYLSFKDLICHSGIQIDTVISPEAILTDHITRLIEYPGAIQVLDFADGVVQLVGVKAYHDGPLVGSPLIEMREHMPNIDARVAAIYRKSEVITPKSDTVIKADDEVFFVAARKHIRRVMGEMRKMDFTVKRIMLAGGGNIGLGLAKALEGRGYGVKIIEHDPSRAEAIANEVKHSVVLHGDAADSELLQQENIEATDIFCAITENDEINILSAMVAKRLGAKRVMALVNRRVYLERLEHDDIDVIIAPRVATVGSILAHIRRGDVVAVHSLRRGMAEAIEAVAHGDSDNSRVVGRNIRELDLPPGTGIGAIVRDGDVVIPHKNEVIQSEDHVILFMVDKKYIRDVEALFQVGVTFI